MYFVFKLPDIYSTYNIPQAGVEKNPGFEKKRHLLIVCLALVVVFGIVARQ
jgi:hypothetical protein